MIIYRKKNKSNKVIGNEAYNDNITALILHKAENNRIYIQQR